MSASRDSLAGVSAQCPLIERPPHVQKARAHRRQQPLVQARAVVVALEIGEREREMRERMCAVDDRLDAALAGHPADVADREDLPGEVRDVADVDHFRAWRDRLLEPAKQVRLIGRRHGKRDLLEDDAVAAHALLPGVEHPPVVLVGRQDLVARLQVDAELRDLQGLARIPRDGQFLGVAAELGGQAPADRLEVRLEHLPHVVDGGLVRDVEIPLHRLVDHARARAHAAVVEIDDGAIEREGLADVAPEVLVLGHVIGRPAGRRLAWSVRRGPAGRAVQTPPPSWSRPATGGTSGGRHWSWAHCSARTVPIVDRPAVR